MRRVLRCGDRKTKDKVDEFYKAAILAGASDNISPAHDWNTIRDTMPLMYSTQTDIHSRSSIKACEFLPVSVLFIPAHLRRRKLNSIHGNKCTRSQTDCRAAP